MRSILFLFLSLPILGSGQAFKKTTTYAGVELVQSVTSFGTERADNVFYFRTDGTFSEYLYEDDWRTRIDGNYNIEGDNIVLDFTEERERDTIFMDPDHGTGKYRCCGMSIGWGTLKKMVVADKVPLGLYSYDSASGDSSPIDFAEVSTFSSEDLYILEGQRFTRDSNTIVALVGSNIAMESSRDRALTGTYKIKDGLLRLEYDNGVVEEGSFFYDIDISLNKSSKEYIAAFKGNVYVHYPSGR